MEAIYGSKFHGLLWRKVSPIVGYMAGDMVYSNIPRNTEIRGLKDGNRSGNGYVGGSDLEI